MRNLAPLAAYSKRSETMREPPHRSHPIESALRLSIFHCSRSAVRFASSITNFQHLFTKRFFGGRLDSLPPPTSPGICGGRPPLGSAPKSYLSENIATTLAKTGISHQFGSESATVAVRRVVGSMWNTTCTQPVKRVAAGGIDDRLANHNCSGRFVATLINETLAPAQMDQVVGQSAHITNTASQTAKQEARAAKNQMNP